MRDLRVFFARAPQIRFQGTVHRICLSAYAGSTLSMCGAFTHGGRFNIPEYFGCLYASMSLETARAEMGRYFTVPPEAGFVGAAIELRLLRVVDLTGDAALKWAGVKQSALTGPHTITREFGLRAWECGIEALLVPSAANPDAANIAVFLDNQAPGWTVRLRKLAPVSL